MLAQRPAVSKDHRPSYSTFTALPGPSNVEVDDEEEDRGRQRFKDHRQQAVLGFDTQDGDRSQQDDSADFERKDCVRKE